MEPMLMVVGLNHRAAPLAMRERFWISENRRYEALRRLKTAEGIEELLVLSTRCRTEFLLWASEPTLAANSLIHYLSAEHGLKLSDWERFYRRLDAAALAHVFRLACSLDCQMLCGSEVVSNLTAAWQQARTVGAAGRYLNAVVEKALSVAEQVRERTRSAKKTAPVPAIALDLARQVFGSLEGRRLLLLGADKTGELAARIMSENGAASVVVIDQSPARAQELAGKLGGTAATQADRWSCLLRADIVISATGCPRFVLTREEAERVAAERNRAALLVLDLDMPRDVDPEVRRVDGILLYDFDGLERALRNQVREHAVAPEVEEALAAEVQAFRDRLRAGSVVPTSVALRQRLGEMCRPELEFFIQERGPFGREQQQALHAVTARVIQKIANSVAHELKELVEEEEREQMAAAIARVFHLDSHPQAAADSATDKRDDEPGKRAINY